MIGIRPKCITFIRLRQNNTMIYGIALRNILFSLESRGEDFIDLLEEVKLTPDELYKTDVVVSPIQLGEFIEKTVERLHDHRIGLRIGFESPFSTLGILGQIYQSCNTYNEALDNMRKHIDMVDTLNHYDFEVKKDGIYHITKMHPDWLKTYPVAARQLTEHNIGFSIRSRREFLGREVKPIKIYTPYAKEGEKDLLEEYFTCPIEFGADALCIVLPLEMLEWKIPTANPDALQMYESYIQRLKGQRNIWTEHTKQHIFQQLKQTSPTLSLVSSLMNLSPRTLQRYLKQEETTFQELLDKVRFEAARLLLMQPQLSMNEIAEMLGFDVQNSFNRFLQKRVGKSPKELRKELLGQ